MAKGIPTISTRLGEVERFIQQGVTGYCSDDADELADAYVTLAKDPVRRAEMGAVARRQCVAHYSMETAAAMFADVITGVIGVDIRSSSELRGMPAQLKVDRHA